MTRSKRRSKSKLSEFERDPLDAVASLARIPCEPLDESTNIFMKPILLGGFLGRARKSLGSRGEGLL